MFVLERVRILSCETKDWEISGKSGKFYPTMFRYADKIFTVNSKTDLSASVDSDVDLEFELQSKTPKNGQPYTGVRIVGLA